MPEGARDLLKKMLAWDLQDRPSCLEALQYSPWLAQELRPSGPMEGKEAWTGLYYSAHVRSPFVPTITTTEKERLKLHFQWLSQEQEAVRRGLKDTGLIEGMNELQEVILHAVQ